MRKKIYVLVCIMSIGLTSCAETPKEEVVVDRSEGLPKGSILDKDDDTPKDMQIPDHWQEKIERSDGFVTLEADYTPQIPEIYNTPVDVYEMEPMTNDFLKKMCNYFSDGDQLYEYPKMTKDELTVEKEKMSNFDGSWASMSEGLGATKYWQDQLDKMDQLIEGAPEKREKIKSVKPALTEPMQTERDFWDGQSDYYYDTDEKIGFAARIDRSNEIDPFIRAAGYSDKVGSTSNFTFSQGTFIDEAYLSRVSMDNSDSTEKYDAWVKELNDRISGEPSLSEEEALQEAEDALEALSVTGFSVENCVKAIGNKNTESWALWDSEHPFNEIGYSVYFYRKLGDVMGYNQRSPEILEDIPETVYAPLFPAEKIQMIITKDGVQKFEWMNISKKVETVAENTKLLSFGKIKEKLADHLLYAVLARGGEDLKEIGTKYLYTVTNVQLRAANVNAFEEPTKVWMVPVWVFDLEQTGIDPDGNNLGWGTKTVVLNAIDGGFVTARAK